MTKKLAIMSLTILFTMAVAGMSFAKFVCTVESVDGDKMILKGCEVDKAAKIKKDDQVTITKKKDKPEGC